VASLLLVLRAQGQWAEIESLYRAVIADERKTNDRGRLPNSLRELAELLLTLGRNSEAEPLLHEAESMLREELALWRSAAPGHETDRDELSGSLRELARVLSILHRDHEAKSLLREAASLLREELAVRRRDVPLDDMAVGSVLAGLGLVLCQVDTPNEAEPLLRESLLLSRKWYPHLTWMIAKHESLLGGCLTAMKRYPEAELLLVSASKNVDAERTTPPEVLRDTLDRIITLYESWGRPEQAAAWRLKRMDSNFPVDPFAN